MWYHKFYDNICYMLFSPYMAYFYFWMKYCGYHYEFVVVMVNGVLVLFGEQNLAFNHWKISKYNLKSLGET